MQLYISALDHAVEIQQLCSSAAYKQNVLISLRLSDSVQCRRGLYFRPTCKCYISALKHVRVLILSSYVLLACINKTDNSFHAWVI